MPPEGTLKSGGVEREVWNPGGVEVGRVKGEVGRVKGEMGGVEVGRVKGENSNVTSCW